MVRHSQRYGRRLCVSQWIHIERSTAYCADLYRVRNELPHRALLGPHVRGVLRCWRRLRHHPITWGGIHARTLLVVSPGVDAGGPGRIHRTNLVVATPMAIRSAIKDASIRNPTACNERRHLKDEVPFSFNHKLVPSCPSWDRTRTLLIQSQACCQLHQGAKKPAIGQHGRTPTNYRPTEPQSSGSGAKTHSMWAGLSPARNPLRGTLSFPK
jgi:hypothetical protein